MPKIINERYKELLENNTISVVFEDDFKNLLFKLEHKLDTPALRVFFILLYWTGRRPAEILELTPECFAKRIVEYADSKGKKHKTKVLQIVFVTKKKGIVRSERWYSPKNLWLQEAFSLAFKTPPYARIFAAICSAHRNKVKWKRKDGCFVYKEYLRNSGNVDKIFLKQLGIPPYFFRHNRFTLMANQGATLQEIAAAKGSKDTRSAERYLHETFEKKAKMAKRYS